jgi:predicted membrane channel-forming protein YqfA (hemolysin III family)
MNIRNIPTFAKSGRALIKAPTYLLMAGIVVIPLTGLRSLTTLIGFKFRVPTVISTILYRVLRNIYLLPYYDNYKVNDVPPRPQV